MEFIRILIRVLIGVGLRILDLLAGHIISQDSVPIGGAVFVIKYNGDCTITIARTNLAPISALTFAGAVVGICGAVSAGLTGSRW